LAAEERTNKQTNKKKRGKKPNVGLAKKLDGGGHHVGAHKRRVYRNRARLGGGGGSIAIGWLGSRVRHAADT
jgi:hypothetical protein